MYDNDESAAVAHTATELCTAWIAHIGARLPCDPHSLFAILYSYRLRAFQTIDTDGSGTIGHDELGALLEDMGLTFESATERHRVVTAAVEALDADLSGEISEEEFVTWISN